jgi:uncharacterized protein YjbJ (UPF0337 family)
MVSAQEMTGKWNQIRGKVKAKWGQLTDDDLQYAGGNVDQLVGKIQQRTGEAKQKIESFINDLMGDDAEGMMQNFADKAQHGYEQVSERMKDGYRKAEQFVTNNPGSSAAGVFVGGLICGVFVGLLLAHNDK